MKLRYIDAPQPLEERVDKAGIRQREDPEGARESRERGRREAPGGTSVPGWWWFDGEYWYSFGETLTPEDL